MPAHPTRGLLAAIAAALFAACGLIGHPPGGEQPPTGQPPGHTVPQLDCHKVAEFLNPHGRLRAMIAVHAHAFGADDAAILPLIDAATVLECDFRTGFVIAISRKRRAVAELAAYGRLNRFAEEIAIMGANLQAIRMAVQKRYPHTFWYLRANPAVLEMVVSNMIAENPPLGGLAAATPATPTAPSNQPPSAPPPTPDPRVVCATTWTQEKPFAVWHVGPAITVDGKVSVAAPVKTVEQNMDPQRWDTCSPFWDPPDDETMLVEKLGSGGFKKMSPTPTPGTDYGFYALYEHFQCGVDGCLAWFTNLLSVKTDHVAATTNPPAPDRYVVTYSLPLNDHLDGCVGSGDPKCGSPGVKVLVDTDWGWLEVYEEKMRTTVYTHKEVKLDNAVANGISKALLAYAELDRQLAEHACCLKAAQP